MNIQVQAADPIVEKAARKLLGIEGVPKEEQTKMVRRALKAVAEMVAELRADAALVRSVRMMPIGAMLWRSEDTWYLHPEHGPCLPMGSGVTLEDALRQAGLMEVEK